MNVVIPAAGNGTRLWPVSKKMPKEMIRLGDKVMIDYAIEEALSAGAKRIGIIINEKKKDVEKYVDERYSRTSFEYFFQESPRGLGDAIKYVEKWAKETFGVILPDEIILGSIPAIGQLMHIYERFDSCVIGVTFSKDTERYGVVMGEEVDNGVYLVKDLIEKPPQSEAPSNMVIIGRYILTPDIFQHLGETNSRTGEVELTDGLGKLLGKEDVYAVIVNGTRFDCGNMDGLGKYLKHLKSFRGGV